MLLEKPQQQQQERHEEWKTDGQSTHVSNTATGRLFYIQSSN